MYPWLIAIALVLLFMYLYNKSNGEGFLNYYPYRNDNDHYPYRYNNDRYPYRNDNDFYNYSNRNPCQNCGYLREKRCSKCSNCGWCINSDGKGQCVPGTAVGPLFTQDCVYYSQNERPLGQRYPYPYRRKFWENVWGNKAINENKTI